MNNPDYSIYDDTYILSDIWACWVVYSRGYLRSLNSSKSLGTKSIVSDIGKINTIVDLGCGIGYTTAGLKELFPYSNVYGTNIEGSCQYKIATQLGLEHNFKIIPDIYSLAKKVDMVFASEYFEHIENSCEHLIEIIDKCEPKFILTANSFNTISLGHFLTYKFNGKKYNGKTTSNLFGKILRSKGYTNVKTNCWNSRPTYWKKN